MAHHDRIALVDCNISEGHRWKLSFLSCLHSWSKAVEKKRIVAVSAKPGCPDYTATTTTTTIQRWRSSVWK